MIDIDFRQLINFYNLKLKKCFIYELSELNLSNIMEVEMIESEPLLVKQIWIMKFNENLLEPIKNHQIDRKELFKCLKENYVLEYINLYKNQYFTEYSTDTFIKNFSALIEDNQYTLDTIKDYSSSLNTFFNEFNKKENLNEKFFVSTEKVKINFVFYCILANSTKNIVEEKTLIFQKYFRRFKIRLMFKSYISKVSIIQRKWRSYYYLIKYKFDYKKSCKYILRRTIAKDNLVPKLLKQIMKNASKADLEKEELIKVAYICYL